MRATENIRRSRTAAAAAGLAVLGALAAGCGDEASTDAQDAGTSVTSTQASGMPGGGMASAMPGMSRMPGMAMNDPSATPANKIDGAAEASFQLLDTRPPGTDGVKGTAWLAQDGKTTLTVNLTGLKPSAQYVGHLHAQPCAAENGGAHFKFDANGPDTPPNEVHIGFTAGADGMGMATVTNDREVGDAAKAVVIHPADALDNRLACADF
ncbi:superoxide dismutase family protein [Mangrovihabitans endophyticus]|uniref:superoxide dismutase family protein n=1 Tax=Mangrovihabitans endophyticus TaxID=1751298 RepID=UPI00166B44B9|nr:superoxide dismutase family protein [Mangrovihabitans endophyticus]